MLVAATTDATGIRGIETLICCARSTALGCVEFAVSRSGAPDAGTISVDTSAVVVWVPTEKEVVRRPAHVASSATASAPPEFGPPRLTA